MDSPFFNIVVGVKGDHNVIRPISAKLFAGMEDPYRNGWRVKRGQVDGLDINEFSSMGIADDEFTGCVGVSIFHDCWGDPQTMDIHALAKKADDVKDRLRRVFLSKGLAQEAEKIEILAITELEAG